LPSESGTIRLAVGCAWRDDLVVSMRLSDAILVVGFRPSRISVAMKSARRAPAALRPNTPCLRWHSRRRLSLLNRIESLTRPSWQTHRRWPVRRDHTRCTRAAGTGPRETGG